MKELSEFVKDWEYDVEMKSAKHVSGLKIDLDCINEDGSPRLAISGMSTFLKNTYAELKDVNATNQRLHELEKEFIEIYKQLLK
jgi:hypothetical protein